MFVNFSYNYEFENNINNDNININLRQLKTLLTNTKYIENYKNIIAIIQQYIKLQNYIVRIKRTKFYKKSIIKKSSYLYIIYNKKKIIVSKIVKRVRKTFCITKCSYNILTKKKRRIICDLQ